MSPVAQISQLDIGKRVTIRLKDGSGFRDIVGHLVTTKSIRSKSGEILHFDPAQIYLWREIIERPRGASSGAPLSVRIYELERTLTKSWQPSVVEEQSHWIFRAENGRTRRANSAIALNSPTNDEEITEMIKGLITWYQGKFLSPIALLIPQIHSHLNEHFNARGFSELDLQVMVKDLPENLEPVEDMSIQVNDSPSDEWLAIHGDEPLVELLERSPAQYLSIKDKKGSNLLAIGRVAFVDDWAVLSRVWVNQEHRNQGLGRKTVGAMEQLTAQRGIAKIALQVSAANLVAINLYKSMDYQIHHSAKFRELPLQRDPLPNRLS